MLNSKSFYQILATAIIALAFTSCDILKSSVDEKQTITLPKTEVAPQKEEVFEAEKFQLARPIIWRQEHIKLKISFDIVNETAFGEAVITLTPNVKSNLISLNAVGFQFQNAIELTSNKPNLSIVDLDYSDSLNLNIGLSESCHFNDTLKLSFKYKVKPNTLYRRKLIQSENAQGLFFINPDGSGTEPTQIWTQGETQSNSCWIPCIDAPNQKTSQEFFITVDTPYSALSNGRQVYILLNANGTRTFYWKQNKKHAPYLSMIAIGKFAIVEDEGEKDLPIYYYVEPAYAEFAQQIFGKTPEIISFFENTFGFDYPWDKYAQVCVREFVSGAMENTSATTIMDRIQQDNLQLADYDYEEYIVHELAHQWFGDLVTCESWANLALNESFATYGEYLWVEAKYGPDAAVQKLMSFKNAYFAEANLLVHPLINYGYADKDHMFNRHSYQKGALFLHTLRNHLGDEFFFAGIKKYLHQNAFKAADVDHLRHAFEEVSGTDLTNFFKTWALKSNHPRLEISHEIIDSTKQINITIRQAQAYSGYATYALNLPIEIKFKNGQTINEALNIDESIEHFSFELKDDISFIHFNTEHNPLIDWESQFNANFAIDLMLENDLSKHNFGVDLLAKNWHDLSADQKKAIINYNNSWGRKDHESDFALLFASRTDSTYYDFTPLLKSKKTFVVSRTLSYMGLHNAISKTILTDFLQTESYAIKRECLNQLALAYNADIEQTIINELDKNKNPKLEEIIIDILLSNGSANVNSTIQGLILKDPKLINSYSDYTAQNGLAFFKTNFDFFKKMVLDNQFSESEIKALKENLRYSIEANFEPTNQLEALELVEKM